MMLFQCLKEICVEIWLWMLDTACSDVGLGFLLLFNNVLGGDWVWSTGSSKNRCRVSEAL